MSLSQSSLVAVVIRTLTTLKRNRMPDPGHRSRDRSGLLLVPGMILWPRARYSRQGSAAWVRQIPTLLAHEMIDDLANDF